MDSTAQSADPARGRQPATFVQGVLDACAAMITVSDRDGHVVYANPATERVSGYPVAEFMAAHPFDRIHPDDHAACTDAFTRLIDTPGLTVELEHRIRHADGGWHWVAGVFTSLFHDPAVHGLVATVRDITERKRAEAHLRRAAERDAFRVQLNDTLRVLAEPAQIQTQACRLLGAHLAVDRCYFVEINAPEQYGRVHHDYVRGDAPSLAGTFRLAAYDWVVPYLQRGDAVVVADTETTDLMPDADRAALAAISIRSHISIPLIKAETLVGALCVTGAAPRMWSEADVDLVRETAERIWATIERARAEAALRTGEQRLRVLIESVRDYAIFTLDPDGRVTSWNEGARRIKGYRTDEIVGQSVARFYTPEDVAARIPEHEREIALRVGRAEAESWRVRKDGSRLWANEIMTPLIGDDGAHLGFTKVCRDMTTHRQAEEALTEALTAEQQVRAAEQAARSALEEASRLKDEFLATVSHELRTPVTAMLGYAYLLTTRPDDPAYVMRTADKLSQSAKAQARLVEDLLDVSRSLSSTLRVSLTPIDLVPVVQAAIDTVRPAILAKGVQLRVALDGSAIVQGDAQRLEQVLWNVLSNAVKFTPSGGQIDVELQPLGGQVQLVVRDSGQGIKSSFLPHVFERFRQEDASSTRASEGLGLGLALVRQLVELHRGTIEVHSAGEGQGTAVRLVLPLTGTAAQAGGSFPAQAEYGADTGCPPALEGLRVLVVDDQVDLLGLVDETLRACGAEVRTHTAAEPALAELRAWQPDVLIADIAMPGKDGYWLIRQVRALPASAGGHIPALALTAYVRIEERLRVLHAGYQLFVPKPVEPAELRGSVARLVSMGSPEQT